jgi:hypothetical protein
MTISTYATLQDAVASYLHRTDLAALIPNFISLAEATLLREISIPETEASVDGVTVGGYALLPNDFGTLSKLAITYAGATRLLDYIALADVSTATDANPGYYSFQNGKLRIYGTGSGQAYTLYYIPAIVPLSTINTSNWLLQNAPDLYLYASAMEATKHLRDDDHTQRLFGMVQALLDSVRRMAQRKGVPIGGRLQIKTRR